MIGAQHSTVYAFSLCNCIAVLTSPVSAQRPRLLQTYFDGRNISGVTRSLSTSDSYKLYTNLWIHAGRVYAIADSTSRKPIKQEMTQNTGVITLPVVSADVYYQNLQKGQVPGNTLLLDFPFPAFPDNMGHWAEILAPAFSCLYNGSWTKHLPAGRPTHLSAILLINLKREQLQGLRWVQEMLRLTVAPAAGEEGQMPIIIHADDLEQMEKSWWLSFETLLVPHDRYSHPKGLGGFATPDIGKAFRLAAYQHASINWREEWEAPGHAPRTITLLTAVGGERVANAPEVVDALRDAGNALGMRVRPYSVTAGAPFQSFVGAMARTGVLISRHGPLLANTMFLPPGAMVLELLPYNWDWRGISEIYVNLTRSIGDVHHFAWRARHPRWAQYSSADEARYAEWTAEECSSRDCLEVHARANMVVDTANIHEMLMDLLPPVARGFSVASLAQPWPSASHNAPSGRTGLWWDK